MAIIASSQKVVVASLRNEEESYREVFLAEGQRRARLVPSSGRQAGATCYQRCNPFDLSAVNSAFLRLRRFFSSLRGLSLSFSLFRLVLSLSLSTPLLFVDFS
jgi:hypothetical protein